MSQIQNAMIEASKAIKKAFVDVRAKKLCHYTSPDGLMGIFNNSSPTLFFSQYDSLNDTKERKVVLEEISFLSVVIFILFCYNNFNYGVVCRFLVF